MIVQVFRAAPVWQSAMSRAWRSGQKLAAAIRSVRDSANRSAAELWFKDVATPSATSASKLATWLAAF